MVTKIRATLALIAMGMLITAASCATAANTTENVGDDTGSAASSVGSGVVAVIEWPFHVIADIL
ncbi:MAG TPA: hypothetical protein VKR29_09635 [Candidatus Binataceae bacterium]|nr:hypothetical protein [Candidatus Binataceae bacterium]